MDARTALNALWGEAALPAEALSRVEMPGAEPALPSTFAVGTAAQASIAASALAAAELLRLRGGPAQQLRVDMRNAALEFRSERYLRVDGAPHPDPWDRIAGTFRCGDGRWVRLHTNLPHHRDGVLELLQCEHDPDAVTRALAAWEAEAFESAATERGLVVAAMRSFAEWDAHPHGQALPQAPLVTLERIGPAPKAAVPPELLPPELLPPEPLPPAERPLSGLRVLELTHVIAGPVCGRTLAAHGADVLLITAPHRPVIPPLVVDTGRGKLSAHLDLREGAARERLADLLRGADVFVQGYRPGALAALGFGPEDAARLRPGIVFVSLSAYGHLGPWAGKRGFDSLVQTATGFNAAEGEAAGSDGPKVLPCQALDHASGYLLAFGAMAALHRRATVGGSWHVRISLARTGHWLRGLGRVPEGLSCTDPSFDDVQDRLETLPSGFGELTVVRDAAELSATPLHWERPSVPLGTHPPAWPERPE